MLSSRDHLQAQAYERRRLLAAFMGDPRIIQSAPWRPVAFGALLAGALAVVSRITDFG